MAQIDIASFDAELIEKLNNQESWEVLKGKNDPDSVLWAGMWEREDMDIPNITIKFFGGNDAPFDLNDFLTAAIRVKGEKTWLLYRNE